MDLKLVGWGNFEIPTRWLRASRSASELPSHKLIYHPLYEIILPYLRFYVNQRVSNLEDWRTLWGSNPGRTD